MLGSLNTVETSLSSAIQGANTANSNIANQNKPGYNQQVSGTVELPHIKDPTGSGVGIAETIRIVNDFLYQNLIGEGTSLAYLEEMSSILGAVEGVFAETKDDGFSKSLDAFFQTIEDLKSNPENISFQEQLITDAQNLVDDLQSMYKALEGQETKLESDVKADIRDIDKIVENIANINDMLARNPGNHLELLDRRDLLEKELSQLVDVTVTKDGGSYELKIGDTIAVLNGHASEFSYGEEKTPQIDRFDTDAITLNPSATNPNDKFVFQLNGTMKIEIQYGETVNGEVVDETNIYEALVFKINNDPQMSELVNANINEQGNIEIVANKGGSEGDFSTSLQQFTDTNGNDLYEVKQIYKDEGLSVESKTESFLKAYDTKVEINNGSLNAKLENLDTSSSKNAIQQAKDGLDVFAATLIDITNRYIPQGDNSYVYGEQAAANSGEEYNDGVVIGLFSGSGVKDLQFNSEVVGTLEQRDYNYLASIATKEDIIFGDKGQVNADGSNKDEITKEGSLPSGFSSFYQAFTVDISNLKQDNNIAFETQNIITSSLQNSYDELVKVDPDKEQINLLKYQATYEASAKIATVIQEMIATMLNMVAR